MQTSTKRSPRVRIVVEVDTDDAAQIETVRAMQPIRSTRSETVRVALRKGIASMLGTPRIATAPGDAA